MPKKLTGSRPATLHDVVNEHRLKPEQRQQLAELRQVYGVKTNREALQKALRIALEAAKTVERLKKQDKM